MLFPLFPLFPGWLELQKKTKKMVDFQVNLDHWLQDASLFRDEPIDSINIEDFFNGKANTEGKQTALGQPGLDWLDVEKFDLSVFDDPDSIADHRNETQTLMEDGTAFLLGLLDSSYNPSYFVNDFKNEDLDFNKSLETHNFITEPVSSEILDTHLASPQCNLLQVNSPTFFPLQSPASPYSDISDGPEESSSTSYVLQSPEPSSPVKSEFSNKDFDTSPINVTVCNVTSPATSEPAVTIEEVTRSVRKRKFVSYGEEIPKVKVILTEYPPSTTRTPKPKDRRERKKVQNKEAAARYRIKKRMEEKELSDEVAGLESQQKELKEKHDELQSEIKYLKSLMCEILQKKGILK